MKKGDKVIIAGLSGYEIGTITHVNQTIMMNQYTVLLASGRLCGVEAMFDGMDLQSYSDEMVDSLTEKHGYEIRFSKDF